MGTDRTLRRKSRQNRTLSGNWSNRAYLATLRRSLDAIEHPISAATARRLAFEAGIIPIVLGGDSQVLEFGRARRLFTKEQRLALTELFPTSLTNLANAFPPRSSHHNSVRESPTFTDRTSERVVHRRDDRRALLDGEVVGVGAVGTVDNRDHLVSELRHEVMTAALRAVADTGHGRR